MFGGIDKTSREKVKKNTTKFDGSIKKTFEKTLQRKVRPQLSFVEHVAYVNEKRVALLGDIT